MTTKKTDEAFLDNYDAVLNRMHLVEILEEALQEMKEALRSRKESKPEIEGSRAQRIFCKQEADRHYAGDSSDSVKIRETEQEAQRRRARKARLQQLYRRKKAIAHEVMGRVDKRTATDTKVREAVSATLHRINSRLESIDMADLVDVRELAENEYEYDAIRNIVLTERDLLFIKFCLERTRDSLP